MTTQRKADLLLVLITGFWGCSYYLSDLALGEMPPFALCAMRFLLAFALLGIALFPKLRHINRKTLLWAVPAGLSLTLTYIGATVGLLYTSISNAGFICSLPAVTTPLLTFLLYRKKPERRMLLCLALCTVGTIVARRRGILSACCVPWATASTSWWWSMRCASRRWTPCSWACSSSW